MKEKAAKKGFFQAISDRLQSRRLGELLVYNGAISEEQLNHALTLQKESRKQIGHILVEQGYIPATKLYRKLSEQWCIKFCTAVVTLTMGIMSYAPSSARAAQPSTQAAVSATMSSTGQIKPIKYYPKLFNTDEIQSNDVSSFKKWSSMMERFEEQVLSTTPSTDVQLWRSKINSMQGLSLKDKIISMNRYINNIQYISDKNNWNKTDYWATPVEFFSNGGDCEDYAIAKYASLAALGIPHDNMRLAIVHDKIKDIPHAILIVYTDEGTFILDNQNKAVREAQNVNRYKPIFSLNQQNWWLHRA